MTENAEREACASTRWRTGFTAAGESSAGRRRRVVAAAVARKRSGVNPAEE